MTVIGEAFIEVKPKTDNFEKNTESKVAAVAKKAAGIMAAGFAIKEGFNFAKGLVADAEESRKIAAQTAAVIKSTGGAANVAAADIDKLAGAISRKTGIDDEAIVKAQNLLLTFTGVRNEVGKGNDIFNQASRTLVDMGAALGTDASGSAIQLGKALNDPVKGITALTRVGVTFTDQQKEQIKTMQEAGNVAGAQKIILDELNKEFGGSAEAQATAGDRLMVTWGNVREELGAKLLPIVDKVATFLADRLPGALDTAGQWFGRFTKLIEPVVDLVRDVFSTLTKGVGDIGAGLVIDIAGLFGFSEDDPRLEAIFAFVERLEDVLGNVVKFLQGHWKQVIVGAFLVFTGPITFVVASLGLLYAKFEGFREVVNAVVGFVVEQLGNLVAFFVDIAPAVQEAMGHVAAVVEAVLGVIMAAWSLFGDDVLKIVGAIWNQIGAVIEFAINTVQSVIKLVLAVINGDWGEAWEALKQLVTGAFEFIISTVKNLGGILTGALGALWELVKLGASAAWDGFKGLASAAFDGIVQFVKDLPGRLLGLRSVLIDAALSLGGALIEGIGRGISGAANFVGDIGKSVVNGIIGFVNDKVISKINDALEFRIEVFGKGIDIDAPDIPRIPRLARGAVLRSTQGGVPFIGAEGGFDEAVLPLPPGALEGLRRIGTGSVGAGLTVNAPLATFELTFGAGTSAEDVTAAMRKVAREELQPVLERVLIRVASGTGTRV